MSDGPFFFGNEPTGVDAIVFSALVTSVLMPIRVADPRLPEVAASVCRLCREHARALLHRPRHRACAAGRRADEGQRPCGAGRRLSRRCDADAATSASSPTSGPASLRQWRLIWEIDDNYNVVGTIETAARLANEGRGLAFVAVRIRGTRHQFTPFLPGRTSFGGRPEKEAERSKPIVTPINQPTVTPIGPEEEAEVRGNWIAEKMRRVRSD